ncbi:HK97 gp10 family phage protein [Gracilimonas sp.]|uniref:HK97 gp10 family phage protein n=1 Tax=Gracilimonas sp. TaxID=1974203 RepID=UPI002871DFA7|nr:HK97 gp10 family phage protein [Gracilimonas sp.]
MLKAEFTDNSVRNLLRDLEKYGQEQHQKTKDNLHEAGINIESEAKKTITLDGHVDTGRLRSSIHYESNTVNRAFRYSDDQGSTFTGSLGVRPDELEVYAGTNVEYAEKIRQIDDYLFPPAEKERVALIGRLKKQLKEV